MIVNIPKIIDVDFSQKIIKDVNNTDISMEDKIIIITNFNKVNYNLKDLFNENFKNLYAIISKHVNKNTFYINFFKRFKTAYNLIYNNNTLKIIDIENFYKTLLEFLYFIYNYLITLNKNDASIIKNDNEKINNTIKIFVINNSDFPIETDVTDFEEKKQYFLKIIKETFDSCDFNDDLKKHVFQFDPSNSNIKDQINPYNELSKLSGGKRRKTKSKKSKKRRKTIRRR